MSLRDGRVNQLNKFASGIADIQILRNPLSSEVVVIFNETTLDQYQDSIVTEYTRIKKMAMVKKNVDMNYVQELGDILLEDNIEIIPWIVSLTTTGFPRLPKFNDCILIDGIKYTISKVKPANRSVDSIINLIIYPERTQSVDALKIYKITPYVEGVEIDNIFSRLGECVVLDVLYGGGPKYYSFDSITWLPFKSKIKLVVTTENQYNGTVFTTALSGGRAWITIDPNINIYEIDPRVVIGGGAADMTIPRPKPLLPPIDGNVVINEDSGTEDGGSSSSNTIKLFLKDASDNIVFEQVC